jgi:hypothetical protein
MSLPLTKECPKWRRFFSASEAAHSLSGIGRTEDWLITWPPALAFELLTTVLKPAADDEVAMKRLIIHAFGVVALLAATATVLRSHSPSIEKSVGSVGMPSVLVLETAVGR